MSRIRHSFGHLAAGLLVALSSLALPAATTAGVTQGSFTFTYFDDPNASTTPFGGTYGNAINNAGQVAGFSYGDTSAQGFVRAADGTFTHFPQFASGINDAGQVVGGAGSPQQGFIRDPDGTVTLIGAAATGIAGATDVAFNGINNKGQIVGQSSDDDGNVTSFLRNADGTFTTFVASGPGIHPVGDTLGYGINDAGQIVGVYQFNVPPDFPLFGFLRNPDGTFTALDPTGHGIDNPTVLAPFGINNLGQIVGNYNVDPSSPRSAFFRDADGSYVSFDATGPGIDASNGTYASGINDLGQIVGGYLDRNFVSHGFIATAAAAPTAVPEPSTVAPAAIAGGIGLGLAARRRRRLSA